MSAGKGGGDSYFGGFFRRRRNKMEAEMPAEASKPHPIIAKPSKRIVCFRLDNDLDRQLSRALTNIRCSRSQFIRAAIERMLRQDGEDRLRAAHSAIRWD
jgi:hypothetical protein